jgi:hypothetical protein
MLISKAAGPASVRVLDIGRFGLRISVPFRLPIQDEVEIRLADVTAVGVVRNCECIRATEFHVGIKIKHDNSFAETSLDRSQILRKAERATRGLGIDRRSGR